MIAYTVLLLFFIGAFSSIRVSMKADKGLALFVFMFLLGTFSIFCKAMVSESESVFSFIWNTSQGQNLKFEIISSFNNYLLIFPCFAITVLAVLNNLFFRYEEKRSAYNAILIFNLTALILLITSNNLVQLITALFVTDILSLFMVKQSIVCRRYSMLNMFADMVLFMVLAIINARVDSLELHQIILYQKIGMHPDFTALVGLTAIFAKLGFWGFQIGIGGLKDIRFHQMQNVLFLSAPMASLILLLKFNALWRISDYFMIYLDVMCVLTGVWAFWGSVVMDNYKSKMIYWMMLFWALMVGLLRCYGFAWIPEFSWLIVEMYVLVTVFYLVYFYNNRCRTVTQMMRLGLTHKKRLASNLLLLILAIMAMANTLSVMYNGVNKYYILGFSSLFIISAAIVVAQIYFSHKERNIGVQHDITFKWSVFMILLLLCGGLLFGASVNNYIIWSVAGGFVLLILLRPLQKADVFYTMSSIQENRYLEYLYLNVVRYLRLCGRLFGILIDHVFLERVVLASAINVSRFGLRIFRRLHSSPIFGGFIVLVLLSTLLWYSYCNAGEQ